MAFIRKPVLLGKKQLRRILALFLMAFCGVIFAVISQSASAEPLLDVFTPTETATITQTLTETVTSTATTTASATTPPMTVIINEIAWMGTNANAESEWIELYNPGSVPVVMTGNGWTLISKTSAFSITLTGTIQAKGYFILERTDDTVINNITANQIYTTTALIDAGESLQLLQGTTIIDIANPLGGSWPAGNASTFCSMERGGYLSGTQGYWFTNTGNLGGKANGKDKDGNNICGTPGEVNWSSDFTPTNTYTPTSTITTTPTRTLTPTRTITLTRTPYLSRTPTETRLPTKTPKRSPTPTRDPKATPPSIVVINEFLSQPRSDWNNDGKIDSGDEYIEIMNLSIIPVSLSGWSLDDQPGDSLPFTIGDVSLEPKARLAFFSSETGILLGNSGDSARLIGSTGQIWDAFTYGLVSLPDQTWCRLPDGFGLWKFGCAPSPNESNRLAESIFIGNRVVPSICLSTNIPLEIGLAECDSGGLPTWGADLWIDAAEYMRYLEYGSDVFILD